MTGVSPACRCCSDAPFLVLGYRHLGAAFVVYHALADVDGGVVKRPRRH